MRSGWACEDSARPWEWETQEGVFLPSTVTWPAPWCPPNNNNTRCLKQLCNAWALSQLLTNWKGFPYPRRSVACTLGWVKLCFPLGLGASRSAMWWGGLECVGWPSAIQIFPSHKKTFHSPRPSSNPRAKNKNSKISRATNVCTTVLLSKLWLLVENCDNILTFMTDNSEWQVGMESLLRWDIYA